MKASRRTACGGAAEACAFLVGVVVLALFQRPALISGTTTLGHDHLYWGVPLYGFFAESVALGRLPLWNPFTHGGEPFYIPLFQLRLLDPPALLVALAGRWLSADLVTLYAWDRFVRGIVIGAGSYLVFRLWARHLLTRLSLIPIVLFSSIQWSAVRQMAVAEQFLVAPFVLLFFLRIVYLGDNRWRNWLASGLLLGLNFQSYFFSGTVILIAALGAGLLLFRRPLLIRLWRCPGLLPRLAATAAIVLVMILPSVVLLSESGRFIFPPRVVDYPYEDRAPNQGPPQYEPRGEIRSTRPLLFPYRLQLHVGTYSAPNDFVHLWAPFGNEYARPAGRPWGKPSEAFMYIGLVPLAVALLGIVAGQNSLKRVWMLALTTMGLLILGPQGFVHALLYWVFPPLWFARNTHTLVLFFVLGLLYFYILGCNRILAERRATLPSDSPASGALARALRRPGLGRLVATVVFTVGIVMAVLTLSRLRYPLTFYTLPVLACVGAVGWWLRADLGRRGFFWPILVGCSAAAGLLSAQGRDRTSVFFLWFFLALPLLMWISCNARARRVGQLGAWLALGGTAVLFIRRLAPLVGGGRADLGVSTGFVLASAGVAVGGVLLAVVAWTILRGGARRPSRRSLVLSLALISALELMAYSGYLKPLVEGPRPASMAPGSKGQSGAFPSTRVATALSPHSSALEQPVRYQELMARTPAAFSPLFTAPDAPPPASDPAATIDALIHGERASTFLMARGYYDLVQSGASGATLAEVFAIDRPLIQFRRDWVWLGRDEARRVLGDPVSTAAGRQAFVRSSVILEPPPGGTDKVSLKPQRGWATGPWRWEVRRYDYNSLDLEVDAPTRGVLYWADGFDPYWRAWVDGKEVPVHRANLAFKAVFVPAGRHAVRFEYRPTPIVVTGLLFVALGFVGALAAIWALVTPPRLPRFAGGGGGVSLTGSPARR